MGIKGLEDLFSLCVRNLPVYCTKENTPKKKAHSSPKILLWEEIKLKKKSVLYKQALFLGYKKFHSTTGVGCLVHT